MCKGIIELMPAIALQDLFYISAPCRRLNILGSLIDLSILVLLQRSKLRFVLNGTDSSHSRKAHVFFEEDRMWFTALTRHAFNPKPYIRDSFMLMTIIKARQLFKTHSFFVQVYINRRDSLYLSIFIVPELGVKQSPAAAWFCRENVAGIINFLLRQQTRLVCPRTTTNCQ